jgi:preprotein translocase SecE subunit
MQSDPKARKGEPATASGAPAVEDVRHAVAPEPARRGGRRAPYKKNQGRMVRMAAFWTLAILLLYGSDWLKTELTTFFPNWLGRPFGYEEGQPRSGLYLPILHIGLSPAFLISAVALVGGIVLLHRWLEKPKNADLLIETEAELKKVTWPTFNEAVDGSVVVIVCVLVLMVFLAGVDWVLGRWALFFFSSSGV